MEQIDFTNIKKTFQPWVREFLASEQATTLTDFQQKHLAQMVNDLITITKYEYHPLASWTPAIVVEFVVNGICRMIPVEPSILEAYPTTMSVFFDFLEEKAYLPNGKTIGQALIAAKADIKQSEDDFRRAEMLQGVFEDAEEEGIDTSDGEIMKAFTEQNLKERLALHTYITKKDAGIPMEEILRSMSTEERDIVLKHMEKQIRIDFDLEKAKEGMRILYAETKKGKSREEAAAAVPKKMMPHILGFVKSLSEEQGMEADVEPVELIKKELKIGRNDPCTCGSGKKYKRCCLRKKG